VTKRRQRFLVAVDQRGHGLLVALWSLLALTLSVFKVI